MINRPTPQRARATATGDADGGGADLFMDAGTVPGHQQSFQLGGRRLFAAQDQHHPVVLGQQRVAALGMPVADQHVGFRFEPVAQLTQGGPGGNVFDLFVEPYFHNKKRSRKATFAGTGVPGGMPLPYAGMTRIRFKGLPCHCRALSLKLP
jgi:hypothetical protein